MKPGVWVCLATAAWLGVGTSPAEPERISLVVTDQPAGVSPEIMGVNLGHFAEGGDAMEGLARLGVNGARVFLNLRLFLRPLEEACSAAAPADETEFLDLRRRLTRDPEGSGIIDWVRFGRHWEALRERGINNIDFAWAFERLREADLAMLAQITCTPGTISFDGPDDWENRWNFWRGYFAVARFLGGRYGVERFQMYNEPDLSPLKDDREDYIERLRLASDAIQCAFLSLADGGAEPPVQPKIYAPVTAQFKPDWAEEVLAIVDDPRFPGGPTPVFHVFAYQSYNHSPQRFAERLADARALTAQFTDGKGMPVAITEFNVFTNRHFMERDRSLDEPEVYSRLGGIYTSLISGGAEELYVFKFSQTDGRDEIGIRRNGLFLVENEEAPYALRRLTGGGEVAALFSNAFRGGRKLLEIRGGVLAGRNDLHAVALWDADERALWLALVNASPQTVDWSLQLPESLVSMSHSALIKGVESSPPETFERTAEMDSRRRLPFPQPARSVCLIEIRTGG